MFLTFSEWNRVKAFSDVFGTTAKKLLKKFCSAQELSELSIEDLKELLNEFSKGHFKNLDEKARLVNQTVKIFPHSSRTGRTGAFVNITNFAAVGVIGEAYSSFG